MSRALLLIGVCALAAGCTRTRLVWEPAPIDEVVDDRNACGGLEDLPGTLGEACAPGGDLCEGRWVCAGEDALRCESPVVEEVCNGRDDDCDGAVDEGCVVRLGTLATQDLRVRVSSDGLAVIDAHGLSGSGDVVLVDRATPAEANVLTPHAEPIASSDDPSREVGGSIDGGWVAWTREGDGVVVVHELASGDEFESGGLAFASSPVVEGDRVVFHVGAPRSHAELWQWTAAGGFEQLTEFGLRVAEPDLSGDWVVYERSTAEDSIFGRHVDALHLETGEVVRLSEGLDEGWHLAPAIDGELVVWQQSTGSTAPSREGIVWSYDLGTGERRALSEESGLDPRVSNGRVCWTSEVTFMVEEGYYAEKVVMLLDVGARVPTRVARGYRCDLNGPHLVYLARFSSYPSAYHRLLPD